MHISGQRQRRLERITGVDGENLMFFELGISWVASAGIGIPWPSREPRSIQDPEDGDRTSPLKSTMYELEYVLCRGYTERVN